MRILHTSDWHLGRRLHEHSLLEDQKVVLGQLLQVLAAEPHDALVVAGDVFDRGIPSEEAVSLLGELLRDLRRAAPSLPVVLIPGNHDSATRLGYAAEIFQVAGIHLRASHRSADLETPVVVRGAGGDEAELWCIPFLWPGSLTLAAGAARTTAVGSQADVLAEAVSRVRARGSAGRLQVAVAHCFVSGGAVTESERTLVGEAVRVDPGLFAGFDYAALGHLHRPQQVAANAWYSGSPLRYSFSEVNDEKSFLSVELRAGQAPSVTAIPVRPLRGMSVVCAGLADVLSAPLVAAHGRDYVRIELSDGAASAPITLLRESYPHLLDLRVPSALSAAAAGGLAAPPCEGRDIETDLREFLSHVHAAEPAPEVVAAFRELQSRLETERAG